MKKTVQILATAIVFIFILEGCKKSIDNGGSSSGSGGSDSSGTTNLVKTAITIDYDSLGKRIDSIIQTYIYDSQNRCIQYTITGDSITPLNPQGVLAYRLNHLCTYTTKTITVTDSSAPGSYDKYYLNSVSTLADSLYHYDPTSIAKIGLEKYFYDANGYLIRIEFYSLTNGAYNLYNRLFYTITNGNTTKFMDTAYLSNIITYTITNSTFSNVAVPSNINNPINFTGQHPDINFMSGFTETIMIQASTVFYSSRTSTFSYTFDSQNRPNTTTITTRTTPAGHGYTSAIIYYTYY